MELLSFDGMPVGFSVTTGLSVVNELGLPVEEHKGVLLMSVIESPISPGMSRLSST